MTPLGHLAEPVDAARAIVMLLGDHAGFLTGVYVPVNGGMAMD